MITTSNYHSKTKNIDWNAVPASLKKTHQTLIPDASKNDWQAFNADEDIRRVVEKYFTYIGKYTNEAASLHTATTTESATKPDLRPPTANNDADRQRARELTIEFLRPYVERGETVEQINKSYLGTSNSAGSFQVKSNKILVDRIGTSSVNFSFPLKNIFDAIKGKEKRAATQPKRKAAGKSAADIVLPEPKQVVFIPTATAFIKRYAALHGKVKTKDQILSLTRGLQKAITEQRIKSSEPTHQETEKMQAELIKLATSMGDSARVEIDEQSLKHYKQIAAGEEVRTSVKLLKSFLSTIGKAYDKVKAAALCKKMESAVDVIPAEDPYLRTVGSAIKSLKAYTAGKDRTIGIPSVELHGLGAVAAGIGGIGLGAVTKGESAIIQILRNAGVKTLSDAAFTKAFRNTAVPGLCLEIARGLVRRGDLTMSVLKAAPGQKMQTALAGMSIESNDKSSLTDLDLLDWQLRNSGKMPAIAGLGQVDVHEVSSSQSLQPTFVMTPAPAAKMETVSARDLARMRFKTIGYNGRFKDVVGDPAIGFHMMVYGKPFQGKSSFVIELCKDLAALKKGRIAYLALEEGISASMQKKVIDRGADQVDGLDFIGTMPASFKGYRFVVIDSVSDRSLKREALRELFLQNPDVCFICIFHATKEGTARGGLDYSHDMDIILKIENFLPSTEKNRFL